MIEIKGVSKSYNGKKMVLKNISFKIESGEIFAFIGHNGAGKTTTIKSIVGILEFEEGDILIDKVSIKENPMKCKSNIAYIPDNPDIYESLTGIQYLNFIADIFNVSKIDRENLIKYYANMFEITSFLGDLISSYSHGMKQKLVIISALIHKPKLMILDEPFVGLDPKASHTLKEEMKKLCSNGVSIFFSTHVLEVAEKLCDKVAIIKEGVIVTQGKMEDVKGNSSLEDIFMELIDNE